MNKPETLIDEETIRNRVSEIAARINNDYFEKGSLVLVGVLKGAFILLSDLTRQLTIPHSVEFIAVSSYGRQGADSGAVRLLMDVREDIEDRHVLIVEDILDTGHTLDYLISLPKSGVAQNLRPGTKVRARRDRCPHRLSRLRDPRRLGCRLWPGFRGTESDAAVYRGDRA